MVIVSPRGSKAMFSFQMADFMAYRMGGALLTTEPSSSWEDISRWRSGLAVFLGFTTLTWWLYQGTTRNTITSWWLNQPIWKILVNMEIFPK